MGTRWTRWVIGVPVAAVALVSLATYGYIHFVNGDAPKRLTVDSGVPATPGVATTTAGAAAAASSPPDGIWKAGPDSQAGYRVKEVLFGQSAEAVGRTNAVTGQIEVSGTTVTSGSFSVDMTTVTSNQARRDNQFRGRIMDVASHPTATFKLTQPIQLASVPADGKKVTAKAVGDLTLRGTTRPATIDVEAERSGATLRLAGSFPIVFSEWGIPNPSAGPATTEDHGSLEFLLVLVR